MKDITNMLKKDKEVKCYFSHIKKEILEAPVLANPYYTKHFSIFSFASNTTIAVVLLQRNNDQYEKPISFSSKVMRDVELIYDII